MKNWRLAALTAAPLALAGCITASDIRQHEPEQIFDVMAPDSGKLAACVNDKLTIYFNGGYDVSVTTDGDGTTHLMARIPSLLGTGPYSPYNWDIDFEPISRDHVRVIVRAVKDIMGGNAVSGILPQFLSDCGASNS